MSGAASIDFNVRPALFDAAFALDNVELGDALVFDLRGRRRR